MTHYTNRNCVTSLTAVPAYTRSLTGEDYVINFSYKPLYCIMCGQIKGYNSCINTMMWEVAIELC